MTPINVGPRSPQCVREQEVVLGGHEFRTAPSIVPALVIRAEAAVVGWLLGSVQLEGGPDQGAILGWFDRHLASRFVYGEITGYYLSFLEFVRLEFRGHAEVKPSLLCSKATHAMQWIRRRWLDHPATRTYLDGQQTRDWRNSLAFSFDQVMMLRGVYAGSRLVNPALRGSLMADLCQRLSVFIGEDGLLLPCRTTASDPTPQKWSTRPGPYQLKAAAALLTMVANLPAPLQACSRKTCDRWVMFMPEVITTAELHPLLYFVEGLLLAFNATGEQQFLANARLVLERILQHLFEGETEIAYVRSDVIAQTLRLGCLLASTTIFHQQHATQLQELANNLVQMIGADGAVYFRRDSHGQPEHANVWSGIFAAQALRYYSWRSQNIPLPSAAVEGLV